MDQQLEEDKLSIQIKTLEIYVKDKKIEDFSILSFLFDVKELNPNLKVPYIYRRLEKEYYKQEKDLQKVKVFYEKSLKVFVTALKFIRTENDKKLNELVSSINETIISNYKEAFYYFSMEFDV